MEKSMINAREIQLHLELKRHVDMIDRLVELVMMMFNCFDSDFFFILQKFHHKDESLMTEEDVLNRLDACNELFDHCANEWFDDKLTNPLKELPVHVESLRKLTYVQNEEMNCALNILFNELIVVLQRGETMTIFRLMLLYFETFIRFFKYNVQNIDLGFATSRLI